MKRNNKVKSSLFSVKKYIIIFLLIAFVVTCSMELFLNTAHIDMRDIRHGAIYTFGNVLFLSLTFSIGDAIRRRITVEKPVKKILDATEKITNGDFSARIEENRFTSTHNEFDTIIENLNKMADELGSIETLRTDFISNVSHELKTPLATMQNYATLLKAPDLSEEKRQEYATAIMNSTKRLSDLITNILKLNKLENQQIFPEFKEYNLGEQLCECLLNFESIWEQKNIEIETDIAEDVVVYSDPELLSLVWNNLLSNAFKFTDNGGIVSVSLVSDEDYISVCIKDTGCGMTKTTGEHIFDKFYQGETSHSIQGNGLGLALVKRVVDITKAEISVQSEVGVGSTFTVRMRRR